MAKTRSQVSKPHKIKILWILVLICLVLVSLILFLGFNEFGSRKDEGPKKFSALDECSLVMGNLIHQMKNDADCKIRCRGECEVVGMDFVNHSFVEKFDSCHTCDCYCS